MYDSVTTSKSHLHPDASVFLCFESLQFPLDVSFKSLSGQQLQVTFPGPFAHGSYMQYAGEGLWYSASPHVVSASDASLQTLQPELQRGSLYVMLVQA